MRWGIERPLSRVERRAALRIEARRWKALTIGLLRIAGGWVNRPITNRRNGGSALATIARWIALLAVGLARRRWKTWWLLRLDRPLGKALCPRS